MHAMQSYLNSFSCFVDNNSKTTARVVAVCEICMSTAAIKRFDLFLVATVCVHQISQMLSPPRSLTSDLRSVAETASLVSRERDSMRYADSWRQRYNQPRAWPESSRGTKNGAALRLDTKAHTYPSAS